MPQPTMKTDPPGHPGDRIVWTIMKRAPGHTRVVHLARSGSEPSASTLGLSLDATEWIVDPTLVTRGSAVETESIT
ncbi:MAG: hypothetical protein JWL71_273 [Acidobacteria bacterium]|nr:hypothetical protein [Acidobacteriota bacterium]